MKLKSIYLFVFTLVSLSVYGQVEDSLRIDIFVNGRRDHVVECDGHHIKSYTVYKSSTGSEIKEKLVDHYLKNGQLQKIHKILTERHFENLNTEYVDRENENGIMIFLKIKTYEFEKNIMVSNVYLNEIQELLDYIVKLLGEDYFHYNEKLIKGEN
ncbi:MAG: hypothetical protein MRY83_24290 [Flavobacteriales bacterium]|nr:hypothetical protein [Flavobacteriales bacterium]